MESTLTVKDFILIDTTKTLSLNRSGYWFVMFRLPNCRACMDIHPEFVKLKEFHRGISFGSVNMDPSANTGNSGLVARARGTRTPISKVPTFIFYADGIPIVRYPTNDSAPSRDGLLRALESGIQRAAEKTPDHYVSPPSGRPMVMGGMAESGVRPPAREVTLMTNPGTTPYTHPWKVLT